MSTLPRLNGIIGALESGQHAFLTFAPCNIEAAIACKSQSSTESYSRANTMAGTSVLSVTVCSIYSTADR